MAAAVASASTQTAVTSATLNHTVSVLAPLVMQSRTTLLLLDLQRVPAALSRRTVDAVGIISLQPDKPLLARRMSNVTMEALAT